MKTRAAAELLSFIENNALFAQGDRVLAGISGGADSTFLLYCLKAWQPLYGLFLRVIHVNHGLRAEAAEDEAFVRACCAELDIPFEAVAVDIPAYRATHPVGIEEAARELRHEAFRRAAQAWDAEVEQETGAKGRPARICLAHHLQDQAETVLFRLARGTSLKGLTGMQPAAGRLVRPLLALSRAEIEEGLREAGLSWREDESNASDAYTRNRIRHNILPLLEEEVNGGAAQHIAATARELGEIQTYLEEQTKALYESARMPRTGGQAGEEALRVRCLLEAPPLLADRVLHRAMAEAAGGAEDITRTHVEDVRKLLSGKERAAISLPRGVRAVRDYGQLYFEKDDRRCPG